MIEEKESQCPVNCPFLTSRAFLPKTMPFYCEKYSTFLGMNVAKRVVKCAACVGKKQNIVEWGLALLEAQFLPQGQINQMKQAFLEMPSASQKTFVSILSQIGCQLVQDPDVNINPFTLMRVAQHAWLAARRREEAPEAQAFMKFLDVVGGGTDPIDGITKTLLSNLFQVLDGTEKSMLLTVMENPKNLEAFLKSFKNTPRDSDLLRNFRALLYESHQRLLDLHLISSSGQRSLDNAGRIDQMSRMIDQMTRARLMKAQRTKQRD